MQTAANSIKRHQRRFGPRVARAAFAAAMTAGAVAVVLGAGWLLTLAWLSARARVDAPGAASADELLALGVATVAVALAGWLCLGAALEVLSHLPGRAGRAAGRWADRLTPAVARRTAAFILGVGVGVAGGPSPAAAGSRAPVGAVSSAVADPGFEALASPPVAAFQPRAEVVPPAPGFAPAPATPAAPGFTPSAPRVRPQADPGLLGARTQSGSDGEVVVHRGDSLWSLAARHLGPEAGDAEIARAWPQWFEANRDRIGDDPDLILPGQVLRIPDTTREGSASR